MSLSQVPTSAARRPMTRRLVAALLVLVALAGSACGSDPGDELTSDELFAPSDDPLDLSTKPPVDDAYLVDVDELITTDLVTGDGDPAESGSIVGMQYVGVLADSGIQFDASWDNGATPLTFELDTGRVIAGWDQGVIGMRVGGRRVLQVPSDLAYGESPPTSLIPPGSDLVFIVDLVSVEPAPPPTPTPQPAPPVPEDALGSFDELGIIDLVEGDGRTVEPGDIVEVQYVGVDAVDGVEFDSSWSRGGAPLPLVAGAPLVIEGWQKGLVGAKQGGERILQVPSAMGYGDGDLVFLIHIENVTEAPASHLVEFEPPAPSEVESETLVEGDGPGAEEGDIIEAHVVMLRHSDSAILQSSHMTGEPNSLFLSPEGGPPGLNDELFGVKAGETRQVIIPAGVAFPDGVPVESGLSPTDAFVFVVEVVEVAELETDE